MSIEKVKWYEELRDYIIENWETILTYVVIISILIILAERAGCVQQCLDRFCGIPSDSQVRECFIECSMPEFLANPVFPFITIFVLFMIIFTLIITIIRKGVEDY